MSGLLDARSPWFPIAFSATLVSPGSVPRVVNIPFHIWLIWRASVQMPPEQPQDYALAQVQSAIAALPQ